MFIIFYLGNKDGVGGVSSLGGCAASEVRRDRIMYITHWYRHALILLCSK